MSGPTIARAEIAVNLNGRAIPAEAEALAREAGLAMGKAHSDAYERSLREGMSKAGHDILRDVNWGKQLGGKEGDAFAKEFKQGGIDEVKRKLKRDQAEFRDILFDPHGFTNAHNALHGLEGDYGALNVKTGQVTATSKQLKKQLEQLHSVGGIDDKSFLRAKTAIDDWTVGARAAEREGLKFQRNIAAMSQESEKLNGALKAKEVEGFVNAFARTDEDAQALRRLTSEMQKQEAEAVRMQAAASTLWKEYNAGLRDVEVGAKGLDRDAKGLTAQLDDLRHKGLNATTQDAQALGSELRRLEGTHTSLGKATQELDRDFGLLPKDAKRIEDAYGGVHGRLLNLRTDFTETARNVVGYDRAMSKTEGSAQSFRQRLVELQDEFKFLNAQGANVAAADVKRFAGSLDEAERSIRKSRSSLTLIEKDFGGIGDRGTEVTKTFEEATKGFKDLRTAIGGSELKRFAGDVDFAAKKVGIFKTGMRDAKKAVEDMHAPLLNVGGALATVFQGMGRWGPIIAGVAALGAPIAALGSVVGGFATTVSVAGVAAVLGLGGIALGIRDLVEADPKTMAASMRPATLAVQDLIGTVDKSTFVPGQMKKIQEAFQFGLFTGKENLAGDIRKFTQLDIPALASGARAMGAALQSVIDKLLDVADSKRGLAEIQQLLKGFAPISRDALQSAMNLGGALLGIFKAALPSATTFAANLQDLTNRFSNFVNSARGQNWLKKWMDDAWQAMQHVGALIGSVGNALASLVTPNTVAGMLGIIDSLTKLAPLLANFMRGLAPLGNVIAGLLLNAFRAIEPFMPTISDLLVGVAKFSGSVGQSLVPVMQNLAGTFGPLIQSLGTFLTVLSRMPGVAGSVTLAFVGMAFLAPKLVFLGTALRSVGTSLAAVGAEAALAPLAGVASGFGGLLLSVGRVAAFLTGPWGIAIGLAVAALAGLALQGMPQAIASADDFKGTLDQTTGALTSMTDAMVAQKLQSSGAATKARELGLNMHDLLLSTEGNAGATKRLVEQYKEHLKTLPKTTQAVGAANLKWQQLTQSLGLTQEQFKKSLTDEQQLLQLQGASAKAMNVFDAAVKSSTDSADGFAKGLSNASFAGERNRQVLQGLVKNGNDWLTTSKNQGLSAGALTLAQHHMADGIAASALKMASSTGEALKYSLALKDVPAKVQLRIFEDIATHAKKAKDYASIIKSVPAKQLTHFIEDAVKHDGNVSAYAKLIKAMPAQQRTTFLEDATSHGAHINTYKALIKSLPAKQQVQFIEDAIKHGADITTYGDLIKKLPKSWQTKLLADTYTGTQQVNALNKLINGVRQGKPPIMDVNGSRGKASVKDLQAAIDRVRQGKIPGLTANNAAGRRVIAELQAFINALHQGRIPSMTVNTGNALDALANLESAINGLHDRAVTVTYNQVGAGPLANRIAANGGLFDYPGTPVKSFAGGGFNSRDGMIAPGGSNILWAEPSTGWEAYISGKAGRSAANIATWMEAGRRLGVLGSAGGKTVNVTQNFASPNADPQQVAAAAVDRLVPQL